MTGVEVVTFGCRLNAYEVRGDAGRGRGGRACNDAVIVNTCAVTAEAVRQARQAIRRARREQPGRAHHRHRLRRADRARSLRRHAEVDLVLGNAEKLDGRDATRDADLGARRHGQGAGQRHHVRARDRAAIWSTASASARARLRRRCRTAATTAAPSASSPTAAAVALGAGGRGGRADPPAGRQRLSEVVLTGVDITSYGADLPGQPHARQAGAAASCKPGARAAAPAAVVDRLDRGRRGPDARPSPRSRG